MAPAHQVQQRPADRLMHACLRINGANVMMSDGIWTGLVDFACMSLSFSVPTAADAGVTAPNRFFQRAARKIGGKSIGRDGDRVVAHETSEATVSGLSD